MSKASDNNGANKQNSTVKDTVVLMFKLGIICIVVAGLLSIVNSVTAPIIETNNEKEFNESMKQVINGDSFNQVETDYVSDDKGVELESVYAAENDGEVSGYAVTTICHEGYGGDIRVMMGITNDDGDLKVNSVKIMSMSETAGLGAKANEEDFTNQYKNLKSGITVEKNNGGSAENNSISAISGATVTSKAVTKAVNCGLAAAESVNEGGAAK